MEVTIKKVTQSLKELFEENMLEKRFDVDQMVKALQERCPEYADRDYATFRALVIEAFGIISKSYGRTILDDSDISGESENSDAEFHSDTDSFESPQSPSSPSEKTPPKSGINYSSTIEISSDEDDGEGEVIRKDVVRTTFCIVRSNSPMPLSNWSLRRQSMATEIRNEIDHAKFSNNMSSDRIVGAHKRPLSEESVPANKKSKTDNDNPDPSVRFRAQYLTEYRPRTYKKQVHLKEAAYNLSYLGGMEREMKYVCELLLHVQTPDIYLAVGLDAPRGILLHGPSGCGKTTLAEAIAGQLKIPIIIVSATELIAGSSDESEQLIRDVFEQAKIGAPCVLFIDEIEAITTNSSFVSESMERRFVSQLTSSLDDLHRTEKDLRYVLVIGATTRPNILDPALRCFGRLDYDVAIGIPSRREREDILQLFSSFLTIDPYCDLKKLSELTAGYTGGDLWFLSCRAASNAIKKKYAEALHNMQSALDIDFVDLDKEDSSNGEDTTGTDMGSDHTKNQLLNANSTTNNMEMIASAGDMQGDGEVKEDKAMIPESENKEGSTEKEEVVQENAAGQEEEVNEEKEAAKKELPLIYYRSFMNSSPDDWNLQDFSIRYEDFMDALKTVQPTGERDGFITVSDVTWDDIGSLKEIQEELKLAIIAPVKHPEKLESLGLSTPTGVLLCGPPGCGKTLLAKAVANEAGINFISVKGPELINMYMGKRERAMRDYFQRARNSAPCVMFFDEFDALCSKRLESNADSAILRMVNQLLMEIDGMQTLKNVYILAATNRPGVIDPVFLRPGRFDTILFVSLPNQQGRIEIMNATTKNRMKPRLADDVDFEAIARCTENYTGADLAGLVKKASMLALKESLNNAGDVGDLQVNKSHFDEALQQLRPSISEEDRKLYDVWHAKYTTSKLGNNSSHA